MTELRIKIFEFRVFATRLSVKKELLLMSDFGVMMGEKCLMFAVRIVNLCRFLDKERKG